MATSVDVLEAAVEYIFFIHLHKQHFLNGNISLINVTNVKLTAPSNSYHSFLINWKLGRQEEFSLMISLCKTNQNNLPPNKKSWQLCQAEWIESILIFRLQYHMHV